MLVLSSFIDPKNDKLISIREKEKYWMPVDLYIGGS
jgi:leucyl-tRNA synthetase